MENQDNLSEIETIETQPTVETVKDPEAVLRKNRELLKENAELKKLAEQAKNFDFEAARKALEANQRAEEDRLAKRGEYDKLLEAKSKAWEERIEAERSMRSAIEQRLKFEKLTNTLMEKGVLPDRVGYLVKELVDSVELTQTDNGFELRKKGGIGDSDEFNGLVEQVKAKSPFFFAPSLASGSGATGSMGNGAVSVKKWADLSRSEKTQAIKDASGDLDLAKKKYS